jgi:prophage antirepressor-like protein
MQPKNSIKIFENKQVRSVLDSEQEKWYISVVDVIEILTDSSRPRRYWDDLKRKLLAEGSELSAKIGQLKLHSADGKFYKSDIADVEQLFRLIQSIPSPKAEPFKQWLAQIARQGGQIAGNTRKEIEVKTGKKVVNPLNAKKLLK